MATLSKLSGGFRGYHQHVKGGAVGFGAPGGSDDYTPTAMSANIVAVGQISSPIAVNMNPTTLQMRSSVLKGPYDEVVTSVDPQITFSMDLVSVYNIALGMSLGQNAISGSSILELDALYLRNATTNFNPSATGTTAPITNEGFAGCELFTTTGGETSGSAHGTSSWQLWKTKVFGNGEISFSGDAFTQIPVRVQAFSNDSDKFGQLVNGVRHTLHDYES